MMKPLLIHKIDIFREQKIQMVPVGIKWKSGFPWQCSDYKGDRHPVYDMHNAVHATETNFNIPITEAYGEKEANDIIDALNKVSEYYAG